MRAGCLSPNLFAPTGLIVLETTGRRSGKPHRTPVLAMLMDGHLIVRTFRGERSHWFQNLRANPKVAYWRGGEKIRARAAVHAPGEECQTAADCNDVGTTSMLEIFIDGAEKRNWFLFEASRRADETGH